MFNERVVKYATERDWRIVKELPTITNLVSRFPNHVAVLQVQISKLGWGMHMPMHMPQVGTHTASDSISWAITGQGLGLIRPLETQRWCHPPCIHIVHMSQACALLWCVSLRNLNLTRCSNSLLTCTQRITVTKWFSPPQNYCRVRVKLGLPAQVKFKLKCVS